MQKRIQKKEYKHLYFDLDQTLWDFQASSRKTLTDLCIEFFHQQIPEPEKFLEVYYPINDSLWVKYRKGELNKATLRIKRFQDSLGYFGIYENGVIELFCQKYIEQAPRQTITIPGAHDILEYLKAKGYKMYLLTNGFKEIQEIKIETNNFSQYFEKMITSEDAGVQKPNRKIFEYALKLVNARKNESIMIGDDINTDILGAKQFGMDCVYFNPLRRVHEIKPTYDIAFLSDLKMFL